MRTEYLFRQEVERVLMALTPSNRLVMQVCLHTGLRLGDVLHLKTAQLGPQFWVKEAKTGKARRVNLPGWLLDALREQAGPVWVFSGRDDPDKPRTRQAVWRDVKRAARLFRLPQNVAPHSARKVYAVELMERYGDIDRVRRALNHDNAAVTMIYAMADKLMKSRPARPTRRRLW